ncbi:MAG TPA: DUF2249 domain-containing protein [Dongiaceae bacterium]|nr:DUF2249 domain-containing protein [Dongiaceae bacterium]
MNVTVDVREDIRQGREPFSKIMNAAAALQNDEQLLVIVPFEPVPLVRALEKQGFRHTSHSVAAGEWEVRFTRQTMASPLDAAPAAASLGSRRNSGFTPMKMVEVDARGLEPPQPLIKILETLAGLSEGGQLNARTDRRPMHLYAQLEERGFTAETLEQPDGSFLTHVHRR